MIHWLQHPEYVAFLKEYIPGHSENEIRAAFAEKFGIVLNEGQIGNFKTKHKVRSGTHGGCFPKGLVPHNKGKKMPSEVYEKVKGTMFKKGNIPKQHRDIGSERITPEGYTEVKVAEPRKWMPKQRYIYEQYHGVKLNSNEVVIFLDGNKQNFDIDNLYMLKRSALVRYCQDRLYTDDKDISLAAAQMAELKAIVKKKREV